MLVEERLENEKAGVELAHDEGHQAHEYLLDPVLVVHDPDLRVLGRLAVLDDDIFELGDLFEDFDCVSNFLDEVELLQVEAELVLLDEGEVNDGVENGAHEFHISGAEEDLVLDHAVVLVFEIEELREAALDRVEGSAEFVRDCGEDFLLVFLKLEVGCMVDPSGWVGLLEDFDLGVGFSEDEADGVFRLDADE